MIPAANRSPTPGKKWHAGVVAAFFCGLMGALFSGPLVFLPFEQANLALRDIIVRLLPAAPVHPGLVFVSLDEGCFNLTHLEPEEIEASPALSAMEDGFPWSRVVYAEMIERLISAGAECVVLDIHFPQPGPGDDALSKVIEANPGLVFVSLDEGCFNLTHLEPEEIEASPALSAMEDGFPWSRVVYAEMIERLLSAGAECVVLDIHFPQAGPGDAALSKVIEANPGRVILGAVLDVREEVDGSFNVVYSAPADTIGSQGGGSEGFVNFWPDRDGVVRTVDFETTLSETKGSAPLPGEQVFFSLAGVALQKIAPDAPEPTSPSLLRFARPGSFPTVPLWQLFVPAFWKSNLQDGAVFEGKTIVFGATSARFRDIFRTPVIADMPGAELHLNALSSALLGEFFVNPPWWVSAALCFLAAFVALAPFRDSVRPAVAILGFLVLFTGVVVLIWLVALPANLLLPPGPILGAMAASGATAFGMRLLAEVRERQRVRRVLERYVSRQIVYEVLDRPASLLDELGGTRKDVTVLFSDLRGFTSLTESSDPAALVVQLNEYLGSMVELIFENGGTIDKFMGDAVMAVWGSVGSQGVEIDTRAAYAAATAMPARLAALNARWKDAGKPELQIGIGLHAGDAIFGNIGSPQKMELTVIGDTVNLASRLEGACKFYGVPFVFSSGVRARLDPNEIVLPLDLLRVKGRREPVEIFTSLVCIAPDDLTRELPGVFSDAVGAYRAAEFSRCLTLLQSLPAAAQNFPPVQIYIARCHSLLSSPMPPDWSPITEAAGK